VGDGEQCVWHVTFPAAILHDFNQNGVAAVRCCMTMSGGRVPFVWVLVCKCGQTHARTHTQKDTLHVHENRKPFKDIFLYVCAACISHLVFAALPAILTYNPCLCAESAETIRSQMYIYVCR